MALALLALGIACSRTPLDEISAGVAPSAGGATGSGGGLSTGGGPSMGGGRTGAGGVISSGGLIGAGGVKATGGILATGGRINTGGVPATGGRIGTGGSFGTGGSLGGAGSGGRVGSGGASGVGGADAGSAPGGYWTMSVPAEIQLIPDSGKFTATDYCTAADVLSATSQIENGVFFLTGPRPTGSVNLTGAPGITGFPTPSHDTTSMLPFDF
jgi:hypothetical protein